MKANRSRSFPALAAVSLLTLLAASCASPPPLPPRPTPRPQPTLPPPPPPAPVAQPPADWRDAPLTPGTWRWRRSGGVSSAWFEGPTGPTLEFRCDRQSGSVLLIRKGAAAGPVPVVITTTSTSRALIARPLAGPEPRLVVALPARDALLDAIVFSRGRFALEAKGLPPIYAPTWPEIARVVEDCR